MSDYTALYLPGQNFPILAGADITGGQVLVLSAENTAIPSAGASNKVIGIAAHDAKSGQRLTVTRGGIQSPTASAAIAAGSKLKSAAAGQVAAWVSGTDSADLIIGLTLTAAAAAGAKPDTIWGS